VIIPELPEEVLSIEKIKEILPYLFRESLLSSN
jgi:hypothetical protein